MRCINLEVVIVAIAVVAVMTSCDKVSNEHEQPEAPKLEWELELEEINRTITEFINGCQGYDAEELVRGIVGEWEPNSILEYDNEWSTIVEPLRVMGNDYVCDLGYQRLAFCVDGTGSYYRFFTEPGIDPDTLSYAWGYDAASRILSLGGDYNAEFMVSGFNGDYIVLDYVDQDDDNVRKIYKRLVE